MAWLFSAHSWLSIIRSFLSGCLQRALMCNYRFFFKICILFVATCSFYTNCIWKGPCRWFSLSLLCRTGLYKKWQKEGHTLQSPMFLHVFLSYVEHSDQTCLEGLKSCKENSLCKHTFMFCLFRSLNKVTWERHLFKISPDYSAPIRILCRSIYSLRDIFVSGQIMWGPSLGVPSELLLLFATCFLI